MSWFPANLIGLITTAIYDASKLPAALVSCGIFLILSTLALIVSKSPGAVLVTWHGSATAYTYYAILAGTAALGLAEILFGLLLLVVPRDLERWKMTAKVLLSMSLVPLAVVLALWAGLRL